MSQKRKIIIPACILCSCFILPIKSLAFDYKQYSKEHRQMRSLTTTSTATTIEAVSGGKRSKSSVIKNITNQLLEALDSDLVPAKMFNANNELSIYFKPAKISKIGVKYKF